jgi:hypothetical protein
MLVLLLVMLLLSICNSTTISTNKGILEPRIMIGIRIRSRTSMLLRDIMLLMTLISVLPTSSISASIIGACASTR